MRQFGYPLYVNGVLLQPPVTISHVPGPTNGVDPSMGGLGEYFSGMGQYVSYLPTKALGADQVVPMAPVVPGVQPPPSSGPSAGRIILGVIGVASTAALAYHGYRRNQSIGWSLVWAIFGGGFPIIGWPIAIAQGFGKSKSYSPNRRRKFARNPPGDLHDYRTGAYLRRASQQETNESIEQAKRDGGAGVISVDGKSCYVQGGKKSTRRARRRSRS